MHYDLAIVAAVLAAAEVIPRSELAEVIPRSELGLDGRVRQVRGILPAVLAAAQFGFTRVVVPVRQAGEAQLVEGLDVLGVGSLGQLVALLRGDPVSDIEPIEVAGEVPAARRADCWTWLTWSVRWRRSGRSRWRLPVGTT